MIKTVTGDIEPKQLGWCQCHEHLFIADGPSRKINDALYMADYAKTLEEVELYKKAGGNSVIDAQPFGYGRMAENLIRVSGQTGVNVIACTGFHKTEFFYNPDWLDMQTEETLAAIYAKEIGEGMYSDKGGQLPATAGVIKCAAIKGGHKANGLYAKLFQAAVQAAKHTNAPIMVHMDAGADALDLVSFFDSYGIRPDSIMFCHLDRTRYDYGYHEEVASTGAYLEYDTIHRLKYHSDEQEIALIEHMVEKGFEHRILLGMDTTNRRLKSYGADFGLDYILTVFGPLLAGRLGRPVIVRMMAQNPTKYLSINPAKE